MTTVPDPRLSIGEFYPANFLDEAEDQHAERSVRIVALEFMLDMLWAHVLTDADDPIAEAENLKKTVLKNLGSSGTLPEFGDAVAKIVEIRLDAVIHRLRLTQPEWSQE